MKKSLKVDLIKGSVALFVIMTKYHGKNGIKQRYKCQNPECKKTFNDFSKSPVSSSKRE